MPAPTDYGLELEIALGIGVDAGEWDTSAWGAGRWSESDTLTGNWVDVTCAVLDPFTLAAGASDAEGIVTRWEAATATLTLLGSQWDPWSGPYLGLLTPMLPVRIRWREPGITDWAVTFLGYVDEDGYHYTPDPNPRLCRAEIACVDATTLLVAFDGTEGSPVGAGETAAQRVTRILNAARWPSTERDITAGGETVKSTTLAGEAWTMLMQVADTDLGLLWVRRDGRVGYRPHGAAGIGTVLDGTLTVCPSPGSIQVQDLEWGQPFAVRNIVTISRQVDTGTAATVILEDTTSVARFLPHTYERTDLIHTSDAWSTTLAQTILLASAWPARGPRSVALDSRMGDPRVPTLILTLEPLHSFNVTDGTSVFLERAAGWQSTIGKHSITATVVLDDITRWAGDPWDGVAGWDSATWGV